jgi:penicillin amidase
LAKSAPLGTDGCDAVSLWPVCLSTEEAAGLGSNNWAVSGAHSATGAALLANDMHLAINVPNIWYRASMSIPDPRAEGQKLRLAGVTLPGMPSLVVGSNGHIAWGFTNTGGDWSDLIVIEPDARDPNRYLTPAGPASIERIVETIEVAGGDPVTIDVPWTIWGPIVRTDHKGRALAQRWVAHDPTRLAADPTGPEQTRTVEDILTIAAGLGIPGQNFVAVDTTGHIGWTIAGSIPRRVGFDGSVPTSWADGTRRWDGYLSAAEYPRIVDPASGRIWTANAPVISGEMLSTIGEGGYADGIRARLIRDRLLALDNASATDMLSVQLDTNALFHYRWRLLLLDLLTPAALQSDARRADYRTAVEATWTGRADPASAAYLLVRSFRSAVVREVTGAVNDIVRQQDPDFDYGRTLRSEGPVWQLVSARPVHLLPAKFQTWNALLVGAVDAAIAELTAGGKRLSEQSWGTFNRAIVAHPLGSVPPGIGRLTNMPADPLAGDIYTPRAHSPRAGPSERMVVSPGREHEGILHMPTGQSGHPLSPHYRDQHQFWVSGEPLPFLPGPAVSTLTLTPQGN